MDTIDKVLDRVYCELDEIMTHQKLDKQDVEIMGELIDIAKDVAEMDSYSEPSGYSKMGGYNYMNGNNSSYMRGRSGGYMPMYNMRGRSGNDGYSREGNKEMMLDYLQNVADMAMDEKDRKAVERLMNQMSSQ